MRLRGSDEIQHFASLVPIACAVPATQASTSYKLTYYALRVAAHYSGLKLQFSPIKPCFLHDHTLKIENFRVWCSAPAFSAQHLSLFLKV